MFRTRAEFLPNTGGHAHVLTPVRFDEAARLTQGPENGQPVVGYFRSGSGVKAPTAQVTTNSGGSAQTSLVAGYMGGQARVIGSATVNGTVVFDTALVVYMVPGLVNLEENVTGAYWIGGTGDHPQGQNFYAQDSVVARLQAIANALKKPLNGDTLFLQFNDASLIQGGTFTVSPPPNPLENPFPPSNGGHAAHNTGLDIDIALCYSKSKGDDGQQHRVRSCASDTSYVVIQTQLQDAACAEHGSLEVHFGNHFHIRFLGSSDDVPDCPT